eukprot:1769232-Pyramimonas_sp.AAC.1
MNSAGSSLGRLWRDIEYGGWLVGSIAEQCDARLALRTRSGPHVLFNGFEAARAATVTYAPPLPKNGS